MNREQRDRLKQQCRSKPAPKWKRVCPRLPDGSKFYLAFDAPSVRWRGNLVAEGQTFQAISNSLFGVCAKLDTFYRKWLREKESGAHVRT